MWRSTQVRILLASRRIGREHLSGRGPGDSSIIACFSTGFPTPGARRFPEVPTGNLLCPGKVNTQKTWTFPGSVRHELRSLIPATCFSTLSTRCQNGKNPSFSTKPDLGLGSRGKWFCIVAKPAVSKESELAQPGNEESNDELPKRSTETDPWLLRNLVVTTCLNKRADRPQGMTFNVGYMDTGGDWHEAKKRATPTVLAIPGQPGSHEDLLPVVRPLHEDGHRVVIVNMPCYEFTKGLTGDDEYYYENSSSDLAEFVYNFMEVLEMTRSDLVVTHSAGSIPLLILSAKTDLFKAGMIICTPSGHVPSRVNRPLWFINGIVTMWATPSGKAFLCWFLPKFNSVIKWLNTDDPNQLMASAKFGSHNNFELMKKIAVQFAEKKFPLVYFASKNDRLVELDLSMAWAKMLGMEKKNFDLYNENYEKVKDAEDVNGGYPKGVLLTKGGHYPQRKEVALPVLVKEAKELMSQALKNT